MSSCLVFGRVETDLKTQRLPAPADSRSALSGFQTSASPLCTIHWCVPDTDTNAH